MIKEFKDLSTDEQDLLYKAPVMVTILIAGADDDIDDQEKATASKIIRYKTLAGDSNLIKYYEHVEENFEKHFYDLFKEYPNQAEERNPVIAHELEKLNEIIPKLDKEFAINYYKNLKGYARKIAESSGGFLGFMAIGPEEQNWVELSMIKDPSTY